MALPRPLAVAIQGERGAYSEEAALQLLGPPLRIVCTRDLPHLFSSVGRRRAHAAMVPMENSLAGSIYASWDLLLQFGHRVRAETYLKVEHCLIAPLGTFLEDVRKVYSHPMALEQCQEFFRRHPQIEPVSTYDTAGSVRMLLRTREAGAAAIAGRGAADHYGAKVLREGLEDDPSNYTRFFLASLEDDELAGLTARIDPTRVGPPKTTLVFTVDSAPGTLHAAIGVFAENGLDLTRLESRPVRGKPSEFLFYLDFLGAPGDAASDAALAGLALRAGFVRILGTYPSWRLDWLGSDAPLLPRAPRGPAPPVGEERRKGSGDRRKGGGDRRAR